MKLALAYLYVPAVVSVTPEYQVKYALVHKKRNLLTENPQEKKKSLDSALQTMCLTPQ